MYRKKLDKKSSTVDLDTGNKTEVDQQTLNLDLHSKAEPARLPQPPSQHTSSPEDKRMDRRVGKVEDLFDSNPMIFDASSVAQ